MNHAAVAVDDRQEMRDLEEIFIVFFLEYFPSVATALVITIKTRSPSMYLYLIRQPAGKRRERNFQVT